MKKLLLSFIIILQACSSSSNIPAEKEILWINSSKTKCTGVGEMNCLQIQQSNVLDYSKGWELFYNTIEGFDYLPGKIYKIEVEKTTIEHVPADASNIKYTLSKIIEQFNDPRLKVHDIWLLTSINNIDIEVQNQELPQIEINSTTMKVLGTDGCNNISTNITILDEKNIAFGPLMQTKKMCADMKTANEFTKLIEQVTYYTRTDNKLQLQNTEEKIILEFKKID